jgi:hypothetical protein
MNGNRMVEFGGVDGVDGGRFRKVVWMWEMGGIGG